MAKIVVVGKSRQVYERIKQDILSGKHPAGSKLNSIRELSEIYEVSKNTVNAATLMLINEGLLRKVDGVGTFVNDLESPKNIIGVMLFDFSKQMRVDTDILSHIQNNLTDRYRLSIVDTAESFDVFIEGVQMLVDMGVCGIIAVPPKNVIYDATHAKRISDIIGNNIPLVFIIRNIQGVQSDFFSADFDLGTRKAIRYLCKKGKRRMAIVLNDTNKFSLEQKQAFTELKDECELVFNDNTFIAQNKNLELMRQRITEALPHIDALIAPDALLYNLTDFFAKIDRSIPEDLTLIGVDNTIHSRIFVPPLPSIAFPVEEIGKRAIESLVGRIEKTISGGPIVENIEPEFIVR